MYYYYTYNRSNKNVYVFGIVKIMICVKNKRSGNGQAKFAVDRRPMTS